MFSIRFNKITEEYEDYDPNLCHNGGSYFQPTYRLESEYGSLRCVIDDASCGEFGTRYWLVVSIGDKVIAQCGCDEIGFDTDYWSDFDRTNPVHEAVYDALKRAGFDWYWIWDDDPYVVERV